MNGDTRNREAVTVIRGKEGEHLLAALRLPTSTRSAEEPEPFGLPLCTRSKYLANHWVSRYIEE